MAGFKFLMNRQFSFIPVFMVKVIKVRQLTLKLQVTMTAIVFKQLAFKNFKSMRNV
jgi:hypothetical protein